MIFGDTISTLVNGHGYQEAILLIIMECMEPKEHPLLQTILEVDMILSDGLTQMGTYGSLEVMDMLQVLLVCSFEEIFSFGNTRVKLNFLQDF